MSGGAIEFDYAANSLGGVLAATLSFDGVIYETIATFPLDNLLFQHVLLYVPQGNQAHLLFGTCLTGEALDPKPRYTPRAPTPAA